MAETYKPVSLAAVRTRARAVQYASGEGNFTEPKAAAALAADALAMAAELAVLRARPVTGRPAAMATTPDGQLVAKARQRLGCTLGELAERVGLGRAQQSRLGAGRVAKEGLTEPVRAALRAILADTK
jgi:hypothetical protein